jgi:hypothetical protein
MAEPKKEPQNRLTQLEETFRELCCLYDNSFGREWDEMPCFVKTLLLIKAVEMFEDYTLAQVETTLDLMEEHIKCKTLTWEEFCEKRGFVNLCAIPVAQDRIMRAFDLIFSRPELLPRARICFLKMYHLIND